MRIAVGDTQIHHAVRRVVCVLGIYHATTLGFSVGSKDAIRGGIYTAPNLGSCIALGYYASTFRVSVGAQGLVIYQYHART